MKKFVAPEVDIQKFSIEDVITTSVCDVYCENELERD